MVIINWENKVISPVNDSEALILLEKLREDGCDVDLISTSVAIRALQMRLLGEYHAIIVKRDAELLVDAEIYLVTWDGEASDGGNIARVDWLELRKLCDL